MNLKVFYENHNNFSRRTISEYYISPGIRCKFDTLIKNIGNKRKFKNGLDIGCSGNSFLLFVENVKNKSFFDIANSPLKQYTVNNFNNNLKKTQNWHPLNGDFLKLPYRDNSFDFICALDTLEHVRADNIAVSELSRILKNQGTIIITVPHRMKYFSNQDKLIGHKRRYEIHQILKLFKKFNLNCKRIFGIYGQLMKISFIQSFNPDKIERELLKLREKYLSNLKFRVFWNIFVRINAIFMKLDAKYHKLKRNLNIAFMFEKCVAQI